MNKPYLVGITGGSASGKTSFLREIGNLFGPNELCILSQDNYYRPAKEQAKEVIKPPKLPESFEKAGGGKERAKAKVDSGTFSFSKIAKNLRERAGITSYKSGGSVSSASKRADGIAQRGKTRA